MTKCPKCGSPWRRVHPNETLEGLDDKTQYLLARQVICTNQECSYQWALSPLDIILHFIDWRKKQGYTEQDAINELDITTREKELEGD